MKDFNNARDIERDIDHVLAGLRKTEAPEDLDRRILHSIDQRRTVATPLKTTPHLAPWRWTTAAACVAAAVLATLWATHKPHLSTRDAAIDHAASTPNSQQQTPSAAPALSSVQPQNRVPHLRDEVAKVGLQNVAQIETASTAPDATSDTYAPSHPAPPLPLTEQEQLLFRLMHEGDPVELAQLNNDFVRRTDEQAAEFQRFFAHPAVDPQNTVEQSAPNAQESSEDQPVAPEAKPHAVSGTTAEQTQ